MVVLQPHSQRRKNEIEATTNGNWTKYGIKHKEGEPRGTDLGIDGDALAVGTISIMIDEPSLSFKYGTDAFNGTYAIRNQNYMKLGGKTLGTFEEPEIVKTVDKERATRDDQINYKMSFNIPVEKEEFYYSALSIEDDIPLGLDIDTNNVKVLQNTKEYSSDKYSVNKQNNKLKVIFDNSVFTDPAFYGNNYEVVVPTIYKTEVEGVIRKTLDNKAILKCTKKTPKTPVQESNKVETAIYHKVSTSVDGEGGTISENVEVDNGGNTTVSLRAKDGYIIDSYTIDGVETEVASKEKVKDKSIPIENILADVAVVAKFVPEPATSISKTVNSNEVQVGDILHYQIDVNTTGYTENAHIEDTLPNGLVIKNISASSGITFEENPVGKTSFKTNTFATKNSNLITIQYDVEVVDAVNGKTLNNTAKVIGDYSGEKISTTSTWVNSPNLHIEKSLEKDKVVVGDKVRYQVILTHDVLGNLKARNLNLTDKIGNNVGTIENNSVKVFLNNEKLNATDARITYSPDGTGYSVSLDEFDAGGTIKIEYYVNVEATDEDLLKNTATVKSSNTTEEVIDTSTDTPVLHKYNVVTETEGNGTISESVIDAIEGTNIKIDYQEQDGSYLSKLIIDGKEIEINDSNRSTVSFEAIDNNHAVKAVFSPIPTKSYKLEKIWKDNENIDKTRPDSLTITGTSSNGNIKSYTLNDSNNWQITTEELPLKTSTGENITWSFDEETVANYKKEVENTTFTNTVHGKTNLDIEIQWITDDKGNNP